jgi:hypothetical protein
MGGAGRSGECACVSQYVSALISADGWDTKGDFGWRVGEYCEFTKAEVWIVLARLVRESCNERACGKSKKRDERPHSPVLRAQLVYVLSGTVTWGRGRFASCRELRRCMREPTFSTALDDVYTYQVNFTLKAELAQVRGFKNMT